MAQRLPVLTALAEDLGPAQAARSVGSQLPATSGPGARAHAYMQALICTHQGWGESCPST